MQTLLQAGNLPGIGTYYNQSQPGLRAIYFHGYQFLSTQEILAYILTTNQCPLHACGT